MDWKRSVPWAIAIAGVALAVGGIAILSMSFDRSPPVLPRPKASVPGLDPAQAGLLMTVALNRRLASRGITLGPTGCGRARTHYFCTLIMIRHGAIACGGVEFGVDAKRRLHVILARLLSPATCGIAT